MIRNINKTKVKNIDSEILLYINEELDDLEINSELNIYKEHILNRKKDFNLLFNNFDNNALVINIINKCTINLKQSKNYMYYLDNIILDKISVRFEKEIESLNYEENSIVTYYKLIQIIDRLFIIHNLYSNYEENMKNIKLLNYQKKLIK